jgi:ribosomal protein L11 methyltransferase
MKWIEIKLRVDGEAAEAVAELLQRYGHQGVSVEQEGIMPDSWDEGEVPPAEHLIVRAYIAEDEHIENTKSQLETALGHMNMLYPMPEPVYSVVDETDWAEAWKVHYHPIRIGRNILIRPLWAEVEPQSNDIEVALDPGMAFGTGTHPSTQLCLESLEDLVKPDMRVLDLGCGSGILAIAAAKLGAASVYGVDIDPTAVNITLENAAANHVADRITAETGSLHTALKHANPFDLAVVNILARIIIDMCEHGLGKTIRPGGKAIFSGIIEDQAADVEDALRRTGLNPQQRRQHNDWVVIEAERPRQ